MITLLSLLNDISCLGGYTAFAYFMSELTFKSFMFMVVITMFIISLNALIWPLATGGLLYCAPKSIILAIPLVGYGIFRFYSYCELVLSGETEIGKYAELIRIAQNSAGNLYTIGAWVSIIIAFVLYVGMCLTIFVPKED